MDKCSHCGSEQVVQLSCFFCGSYLQPQNAVYDPQRRNPEIIRSIVTDLRNGYAPAHAARRAGTYNQVAQDYHWKLRSLIGQMPACPCGKPSMHVGHCNFRVVNDPLWRQWLRVKLERIARKEREREARLIARTERANQRMKLLSNSTIGTVWRQEPGITLIRGERCEEKACPFSVEPGMKMCSYHKHFYAYDESLTGNYLDESDVEYSWKEGSWKEGHGAGLSVVYAGEPRLYFVRKGYVQGNS